MAKFSTFDDGGAAKTSSVIVGLEGEPGNYDNARFALTYGLQDEDGKWLIKWESVGALAVNNLLFKNALTGQPPTITVDGVNSSVGLKIITDNHGDLFLECPGNGGMSFTLGGSGDIDFTMPTGFIVINSTSPIREILDEDNMVSDSATALATQQSIKAYVDGNISGSTFFIYTDVATTANFSSTYDNGSAGVGATLTANSNGVASIDGITLSVGNLVLFKDQTNAFENGIYSVTDAGSVGTPAIYTRYQFFDTTSDIKQGYVTFSIFGNTNAKKSYQLTSVVTTIGVDDLDYQQTTIPTLASSIDNTIVRFDGVSGGQIQGSNVTISDTDIVSGITQLNVDNIRIDGNTISSTNSNGDINLTPDGTGLINLNKTTKLFDNLDVNGNDIISTTGNITLTPSGGAYIDLNGSVWVYDVISHAGDLDNTISFGVDTQSFNTGGSTRIDISNLGVRFGGSDARITAISDDVTMAADSATLGVTQHAAKTYADSVGGGSVTLSSAGGTSLVNDGTGAALVIKGISAGTNIAVTDNTTNLGISITGTIAIANGGTNNTVLGANGTLAQSDGTKINYTTATYPTTASSTGTVIRANGTNWVASTSTFSDTYAISTLLYASGANTVSGLATANSAVLVTSSSGVPSYSASLTDGQVIIGSSGGTPSAATLTAGTGINISNGSSSITVTNSSPDQTVSITNGNGLSVSGSYPNFTIGINAPVSIANGGTNTTSAIGASGTLAQSDGSKYTFTSATYPASAGSSGNVITSNGTNFVSSAPAYAQMAFNSVTISTQALAVNNVYYTTYSGLCTMTLPSTAVVGSQIRIIAGASGNTFKIAQNSGQQILYGAQAGVSVATTSGVTGYIQSSDPNSNILLMCVVADTTFTVLESNQQMAVN